MADKVDVKVDMDANAPARPAKEMATELINLHGGGVPRRSTAFREYYLVLYAECLDAALGRRSFEGKPGVTVSKIP